MRVSCELSVDGLDHDDFGSNRPKIMNVIDSNILRSGMRAENRYTLFLLAKDHAHFQYLRA